MAAFDLKQMRKGDWAAAAVVALLVLLLAFVAVRLGGARLHSLHQEQASLEEEYASLSGIEIAVTNAQARLGELDALQQVLARQVPATLDFSGFYGALSATADGAAVLLDRVEPGAVSQGADYQYLSVQIEARGAFEALYQFLFQITHLPRLIKVQRMAIEATGDPGVCTLELSLHVFSALSRGAQA